MNKSTMVGLSAINVRSVRARALQSDKIDEIADSMKSLGQFQEIVLCPRDGGGYWLVAGEHRLEAAKKLGWADIRATIFEGIDCDHAELIEIDENLIRAELGPAERAMQVNRRKELYERVHPATKQGGAPGKAGGGKKAKPAKSATFADDTAKKTGKSRRKIERDVTRAKKVKVLPEIAGTCLDKGDEIDALAKLDETKQRELAERAKAGEKVSAKKIEKEMMPDIPDFLRVTPETGKGPTDPWERCAVEVRGVIKKWLAKMKPGEFAVLIAEVRSEIDDIEDRWKADSANVLEPSTVPAE
jgi:ParB-like chromosome segregation protein Spo0J